MVDDEAADSTLISHVLSCPTCKLLVFTHSARGDYGTLRFIKKQLSQPRYKQPNFAEVDN